MRHLFLLVLVFLAPLSFLQCAQEPSDAAEIAELRSDAEQGLALAQYNLGYLYDHGQGVAQDYVAAYVWYKIAATQGYAFAMASRDIAAEKLNTASLAEAQKLSTEYFKLYVEPFQ